MGKKEKKLTLLYFLIFVKIYPSWVSETNQNQSILENLKSGISAQRKWNKCSYILQGMTFEFWPNKSFD